MKRVLAALAAVAVASFASAQNATIASARKIDAVLQGGHDSTISAVALDRTGTFLLSGSNDSSARLWDVATGRELRVFHTRGFVTASTFSPDGSLIGIASRGSIRIHRTDTGALVHVLEVEGTAHQLVFCPSNACVAGAFHDDVRLWTLGPDGAIAAAPLERRAGDVLAISPDGTRLAAADRTAGSGFSLTVWNLLSRQVILRDTGKVPAALAIDFRTNDVLQIVGERSCWQKGAGCRPVEVGTWKLSSAEPPTSVPVESDVGLAVALSAGRIALGGSESFRIADAVSGKMLWQMPFDRGVRSIGLSPDATLLATARSDGRITLWRTGDREPLRVLQGVVDEMNDASFADDGRLLSAIGISRSHQFGYIHTLHHWDLRTGEGYTTVGSTLPHAFSPDRQWLVSGEKQELLVARHRTSDKRIVLRSAAWGVAAFSRDSRYFAAGDQNRLQIWNVPSWDERFSLAAPPAGFGALSFDESGRYLAAAGADGSIRVIDVERGSERILRAATDPTHCLWTLSFFPAGTRFAVAGNDRIIEVFDAVTGAKDAELPASAAPVQTLAFRPDGRMLASGDRDGEIRLWDLATRSFVSMPAHGWTIDTVAFSPDGRFLISAGHDGTISVWDPDGRTRLLRLLTLRESDDWLAITDDGLFDGTAEAMRRIYWRIGDGNLVLPVDTFFNEFFHPGLVAEIFEGRRPRPTNDLVSLLQVPGLRTMLLTRLATIERRGDDLLSLCFRSEVTAQPDIYSDGVPMALDPRSLLHNADDPDCPSEFVLPRDTQIEIGAAGIPVEAPSNGTGERPYDGAQSSVAGSTLHVFITGISSYDLKASGFKPLPKGFVTSLRQLEHSFRQIPPSADRAGYERIRVWDGLYDAEATRQRLRERFAEMAHAIQPNDVVLLYFGGHGTVPAGQEMFCFATADIRGPEPALQMETGFTTALFAEVIRRLPARRIVLLIDACQSGGAIESLARVAETKARVAERSAPDNGPESRVGVYVIAAATPLQEALQSPDGESLLFHTFEAAARDATRPWTVRGLVRRIRFGYPGATPLVEAFGVDFPLATISAGPQ